MSKRHNQHISSIPFQEYAYRALKNTTTEQREVFTSYDEMRIFVSDYELQRFCKEERMDRILLFLAKIGIEWTFRMHRDAFTADMVEFNTVDQYLYPKKRVDVADATAREGVCVISSRDVMNQSHMTAQNCTTKAYNVSEFNLKIALKGGIKQLLKFDKEVAKAQEAHDFFNNIILEQLNSLAYAQDIMGINDSEIRILAALYKKRQAAITMTQIAELTRSTGRKMYFRQELERLIELGLVTSDKKNLKQKWANSHFIMITGRGIEKINVYRKHILKNAFEN